MKYEYGCYNGHQTEYDCAFGTAPPFVSCYFCMRRAHRLFAMAVHGGDPFRNAWLNDDLAGKANRPIGATLDGTFVPAPKDSFEARHQEKQFGIKFVGDDASGLSKKGQRAVEQHSALAKEVPR